MIDAINTAEGVNRKLSERSKSVVTRKSTKKFGEPSGSDRSWSLSRKPPAKLPHLT